ncbi:hypothetical protein RHMOL_Rhmol10G0205900 [Rhododendron molle]|uniref:Uncharacterized protein n=1 Tax=Rhododendron molle TaxID=49168 RepID=A0ACC0M4F0_RHOML|nr:hypothetical protein RHMOL_Rhmol10G0205900 [Rhododendron molle]
MAPLSSSPAAARKVFPPRRRPSPPSPHRKFRSMEDIMRTAKYAVTERDDYSRVVCSKCGSGEDSDEILLCDRCDDGYHMLCLRPIVVRVPIGSWYCPSCSRNRPVKRFSQTKVIDFFRIQKCANSSAEKCTSPQDTRKRRRRSGTLVLHKKRRRRILPFSPTEDPARRLEQMGSLASSLTAMRMEFSDQLTYMQGMAPRSANQAEFENGGMQVWTGMFSICFQFSPMKFQFSYTVEADGPIKDMTLIAEYTGDVDYIVNRENDDCDSMMTLLLARDPSKSLVICPDKRGNIARFINGINNHTPDGRKKQNLKCVRYNVNGECQVLLVATRDIAKGERLYYDYNGYEHEYPTHHFI